VKLADWHARKMATDPEYAEAVRQLDAIASAEAEMAGPPPTILTTPRLYTARPS